MGEPRGDRLTRLNRWRSKMMCPDCPMDFTDEVTENAKTEALIGHLCDKIKALEAENLALKAAKEPIDRDGWFAGAVNVSLAKALVKMRRERKI